MLPPDQRKLDAPARIRGLVACERVSADLDRMNCPASNVSELRGHAFLSARRGNRSRAGISTQPMPVSDVESMHRVIREDPNPLL